MDNVNIPQPVIDILELLHTKSSKAYLVGGCVRDMFMHLEPHDYDICSDLTPDIAMKVLSTKYPVIPKGIEYITAMPIMKKYMDYSAEIYATYLKYINQSGRNYRNLNITPVLYI